MTPEMAREAREQFRYSIIRASGILPANRRSLDSWQAHGDSNREMMLDAARKAVEYILSAKATDAEPKRIVFAGDTGRGKSHLAMSMLYEIGMASVSSDNYYKGLPILRVDVHDLFAAVKSSYSQTSELSPEDVLWPIERVSRERGLILLDDLSPPRGAVATDHEAGLLRGILNTIDNNRAHRIITTNLLREAPGDYSMRLWIRDATVLSRMYADAKEVTMFAGLPDYRALIEEIWAEEGQ